MMEEPENINGFNFTKKEKIKIKKWLIAWKKGYETGAGKMSLQSSCGTYHEGRYKLIKQLLDIGD